MKPNHVTIAGVTLGALLLSGLAGSGQQGGPFDLRWSTVDGGGGTCAGGKLSVSGSVGQPDAGSSIGARYVLHGGFWSAAQTTVGPPLRIERSGGDFILAWPVVCDGFHLEASADVTALTWADLGIGMPSGSEQRVHVPGNPAYRFFRLRKDCPK